VSGVLGSMRQPVWPIRMRPFMAARLLLHVGCFLHARACGRLRRPAALVDRLGHCAVK
jgi:hypothetical protein